MMISFDSDQIEESLKNMNIVVEHLNAWEKEWVRLERMLEDQVLPGENPVSPTLLKQCSETRETLHRLHEKLNCISEVYVKREEKSLQIVEALPEYPKEKNSFDAGGYQENQILPGWNGKIEAKLFQSNQLLMEDWLAVFLYRWMNQQTTK